MNAAGLPAKARSYFYASLVFAAVAAAAASTTGAGHVRWGDFVFILVGGAAAQMFAAHTPANQVFHTGLAFTVAAALVLPPDLVLAVAVLQHVPEWLRKRYPWYITTFNTANVAISGLAAWSVRYAFSQHGHPLGTRPLASSVLVAACAGVAYVVVNHVLLARMLVLARSHSVRSTLLFSVDGLVTDLVLAAIGASVALALLWQAWFVPVVAFPLLLIHRALVVPTLREQAFRDHKTGLLNSRGIEPVARDELARARRFGRPLSVLMCDVDYLREINNRYGHLAGDAALVEIADIFRTELRDYDLCARFGGDEFVIVLPEADLVNALDVAARIQERLAATPLVTAAGPIDVTVSIGAATRTDDDQSLADLLERADGEMFSAKHNGAARLLAATN
ncbi:MAG TPA: GGDEF domain-containing protein [Gaiellaceae bacterium]|nr:GGDEF domain-containing protein [Gaiellaceae bacterium]